MLLSTSHRFIFVHVPKTAGTSITETLAPHADTVAKTFHGQAARRLRLRGRPGRAFFRTHDTAADVIARLGREAFSGFTSFAVVRDPFDHARSHYDYLRRHKNARLRRFFEDMDFGAYLDFRLSGRRPLGLPRFAALRDQTSFVADRDGGIAVDRVLRFERLDVEMPALLADLGLAATRLPRRRTRPERSGSDLTLFTAENTKALQDLYRRDFTHFGYDPDRLSR